MASRYEKNIQLLAVSMKKKSDDLANCQKFLERSRAEYKRELKAGRSEAAAIHLNEAKVLFATKKTLQGLLRNLEETYNDNQSMFLAMDRLSHKADYDGDMEDAKKTIGQHVDKRDSVTRRETNKFKRRLGEQMSSGLEVEVYAHNDKVDKEVLDFMNSGPEVTTAISINEEDDDSLEDVPFIGAEDEQ
jgi:hypothetical protein